MGRLNGEHGLKAKVEFDADAIALKAELAALEEGDAQVGAGIKKIAGQPHGLARRFAKSLGRAAFGFAREPARRVFSPLRALRGRTKEGVAPSYETSERRRIR